MPTVLIVPRSVRRLRFDTAAEAREFAREFNRVRTTHIAVRPAAKKRPAQKMH